MNTPILGFSEFTKLFEAATEAKSDTSCFIAYSNEKEKEGQERFVTEVSMMDPRELEAELDKVTSQGGSILAKLDESFAKREELDRGPLTKKGDWYIGKGAWRINSAKASRLGMTPDWIQYFDPMQSELLEKYFPEDYAKSGSSVSPEGELNLDFSDEERAEMDRQAAEMDKDTAKREELAMAEGLKYIRVMESDDFTLGPVGQASQSQAVVVDSQRLVKNLVTNYFLETRPNLMIWGAPGIGKTEVVRQAASQISAKLGKDKSIPVMVITLATKAAYDLSGIPFLYSKEASSDTIVSAQSRGEIGMEFAYPGWLPGAGDEEEGILFFDEINRAEPEVLGAALTLLLDRSTGKYEMPKGWRIWAAGNRDVDGPVKPFEGAVASRFLGGHFHLVPTVDSWVEWARSKYGYFKSIDGKVTEEWYIPDEFISFLTLKDVKQAGQKGGGTIFSRGREYRVNFEYFYNWDAAAAAESGGGQMTGFPTPRTWSEVFKTVFQIVRNEPDIMAQVSPNIDPRKKTISVLGLALLDRDLAETIGDQMAAVVGNAAADAFIDYTRLLSRHNDAEGSLVEKIENIFDNPKGPRPLIKTEGKIATDELFGILQAVEGVIDARVENKVLTLANFIYWQKWCMDLEDLKRASQTDLTPHIAAVFDKNALYLKPLASKTNPDFTPDLEKIIKDFANRYRELLGKLGNI